MNDNAVQVVPEDQFVTLVERLAANPDVDAAKLEKLVDIQIRIMDKQAEAEFNAALARVQAKLPTVVRNKRNAQTNSMYADLDAVAQAIDPVATAEGFSTTFTQGETQRPEYIRICGTLMHSAGHSREYFVDLPLDDKGIKGQANKTPVHGTGSTFAYGRRYLKSMMFDITTGDDNDAATHETLSEEQVASLEALITEVNANKAQFLRFAKVTSLDQILAKNYKFAVEALEQKRQGA